MAKALVVDDSKFTRTQITNALKEKQLEFVEAVDGEEALGKLESAQFDLILVDLVMPKMTGIQLIELMKKKGVQAPIIVVSADVQEPVKLECKNLGVEAFLNKPFKKQELFEHLKKLGIQHS